MPLPPKMRKLGSTRFWSALGAVLGLLATLWATLIGETIPEIISSPESPLVHFYRSANSACTPLPQLEGTPYPGPRGRSRLRGAPQMFAPTKIYAIADRFDRHVFLPVDDAAQALLAIHPPAAYTAQYRRFEQQWAALDHALLDVISRIYDLEPAAARHDALAYRRRLAQLLDANQSTFREVVGLIEGAGLLNLEQCVGGLSGVAEGLQTLDDVALHKAAIQELVAS